MQRHGLTIGIDRVGKVFILTMKVFGKLTHEDYQKITPLIDSALASVVEPKVKVLVDASELEGWELRAAWDDLKLGLKHGNEFEKIAVISNQKWLELSVKIGDWFTSGEMRHFERYEDAINWL
ncbi:STAS/SEC14 domain-containing protein [Alteromonadaceae bacterium BrNp21-10]|nr:STAS/SEC14 domain-containing protein [Alteromonadaceae bacterium BrNp21-10]